MPHDEVLVELRSEAKAASQEGREAAVIELLTPYLQWDADDGYAWYMLGDALRIVGRFAEAERALLKALELAPDAGRPYALSRCAMLYKEVGRYSDAERYFSELAENTEWSRFGWFWILRGANLASLGDFQQASEYHRKATTLEDVDADEAWLNLGLVLRAQGKYPEAMNAIRKSIEIDPTSAAAKEALQSMDGVDNAIAAARRLSKRGRG